MSEEALAAVLGKPQRLGHGMLGLGARFAQQPDGLAQPGVERGEVRVAGDPGLQRRGFVGRKFAQEQGGDADLYFLA